MESKVKFTTASIGTRLLALTTPKQPEHVLTGAERETRMRMRSVRVRDEIEDSRPGRLERLSARNGPIMLGGGSY